MVGMAELCTPSVEGQMVVGSGIITGKCLTNYLSL